MIKITLSLVLRGPLNPCSKIPLTTAFRERMTKLKICLFHDTLPPYSGMDGVVRMQTT